MKRFLALISAAICLFPVIPANSQQPKVKSFAEWCSQKKSLPVATKNTIEILLFHVGSKDCRAADAKLRNLDRLDIRGKKIQDLKP